VAESGSRQEVLRQAEASMVIKGRITLDSQGHVIGHTIDQRDKVPAGVLELVGQAVPHWVFEPLQEDGTPIPDTATMSLLVVARKTDDTHFEVRLRGASFQAADAVAAATLQAKRMDPPPYPAEALRAGAFGTVYALLRIGRDGRVQKSAVEQVNLGVHGPESGMSRLRFVLADAALTAARKWKFTPPTVGPRVDADYWDVRVPVIYALVQGRAYGAWEPYIPGPRKPVDWLSEDKPNPWIAPDTLGNGDVHLVGSGLRLLTPFPEG
jgi:hypothetical protein